MNNLSDNFLSLSPKIRGKRTMVTGASGLLGSHLTRILVEMGAEVWALTHNTPISLDRVQQVCQGQLLDASDLPQFDHVYHIAGLITYDNDRSEELYNSNAELTRLICSNLEFDRIVYASTVSLYQPGLEIIRETSAISPHNTYSYSKYWGECFVKQQTSHAVLRLSSIYGEGIKPGVFISRAIDQALAKDKVRVMGDGSRLQNYIHVEDAASHFINAALANENVVGLATSKRSFSNKQVAEAISAATGAEVDYFGEDRSPSFVYDNSETRRIIGQLGPDQDLERSIKSIVEWMRDTQY